MTTEIERLEEERDAYKREFIGTQEMLGWVLKVAGEVVVPKELIKQGLPHKAQISIEDNMAKDAFVFSLVEPE